MSEARPVMCGAALFRRFVMDMWREGKNTADIADVLGVTEAAVANALPHARKEREAA